MPLFMLLFVFLFVFSESMIPPSFVMRDIPALVEVLEL